MHGALQGDHACKSDEHSHLYQFYASWKMPDSWQLGLVHMQANTMLNHWSGHTASSCCLAWLACTAALPAFGEAVDPPSVD
jgi:hypothetical protein